MLQNSWLFPHRPFDVQAFFERIESPRLQDMPDLPTWIATAARTENLRAEWLCGLMQKEQSALTKRRLSQHGRDWLCGYGYTEGPVYSHYRGARNQVFSAARGLRRYLTPGDSLYVGDWVGKQKVFDGRAGTIHNLAEACALQYTPHWSTLQTVEHIWRHYGFEDGGEAMPTIKDVARVAKEAGRAGDAGKAHYTCNGITFDLRERGYCARFVRQVHEAALKLGAWNWPYSAPHARAMERKLEANGLRVTDPQPGDIVAVNGGGGQYGHIAIYIGDGKIAENTSSNRGPGTTISNLSQVADRVTGYYRAAPTPEEEDEPDVDEWAKPAVKRVREAGIMTGYPDGTFRGRKPITRQEVAVVIDRLLTKEATP